MLSFRVLMEGKPPERLDLDQIYLTSLEGQPIRARFRYVPNEAMLFCDRRAQGLAALNIPWPVPGAGRLMLRTALVPDAEEPYLLPLELARGRIADVWRKKDEWGYVYGGPTPGFEAELKEAKLLLARAMTALDSAVASAALAEEALAHAVALGEKLALGDAHVGIGIRRERGDLRRVDFGCYWELLGDQPHVQERFVETFNYVTLPFTWRLIEPREQEFHWGWHDGWVHWFEAKGIAIKGGSLIRFAEPYLPDWVWIWENDFGAVRDYVFDQVERCVQRYRGHIDHWDAVTGLHVENCMNLPLDRVLELTRVCARAVKRTDPSAKVVLDLVQPWGEYYATNQRSIWPFHYAEMCINAGVDFDVIGLQVFLGTAGEGFYCRDMLAVSEMLSRFGSLGKPVHVTAAGVPSACYPDGAATIGGAAHQPGAGGVWRKPWDEVVQSDWLDEFYHIAISKPFVTAISWRDFWDEQPHCFPHGGLLRKDLHPKIAYRKLVGVRQEIWPAGGPQGGDTNVLWPEL
ncbi:MAG: endo-1,4-beta-xylanase [Phycisphaerae bacterium]